MQYYYHSQDCTIALAQATETTITAYVQDNRYVTVILGPRGHTRSVTKDFVDVTHGEPPNYIGLEATTVGR